MNYFIVTMKVLVITILKLAIFESAFAQTNLSGQVQDKQGDAVPFTNVLLLQATDSAMISGTVSDTEGSFGFNNIPSGNYLIQTLMIGYQSAYVPLDIPEQPALSITIEMREDIQQLDEVVINAQKPLYEKMADRTVVNVSSRVSSTGKSALELLSKSPGVMVNRQNNSISMYGKNGVLVMINGKISRLPIDAVVQMLDGMSAANIKQIELITTPPAKYDAEGNAGIINIVMIENADYGTNGNFGLTAGYNQGETWGGNLNLNHRGKRFNLFLDYALLSDKNEQPWLDKRTLFGESFNQTIASDQQRAATITTQNLQAGFEYDLTGKTTAKVLFTGYRRNWDMDGLTDNINNVSPDSSVRTLMQVYESNIWQSATANLGLSHEIGDHQTIGFDFDYLYYINDNPSTYDMTVSINENNDRQEAIDVSKDTPIEIKVSRIDYANRLNEKFELQMGVKGSLSTFNNKVFVKDLQQGEWVTNDIFTSNSELDEKIWAGYASIDWKIAETLSLYSGLRYEYTDTYLSSGTGGGLVDREFGNFFPSMNISKKLSDTNNVHVAYSRRITRPTYNEIAPFVFFTGPNSFFAGNPGLRPALTDGVDLSFQHRDWWVSLKYANTKNNIGMLQPEIDEESNRQIYRSQNMNYYRTWSFSANLPIVVTSWWELQTDATLSYISFETNYFNTPLSNHVYIFNASAVNTFSLPKDYIIELSGNYTSKTFWGLWEFEPMGQLDLGIKKILNNDKGSLTLSFTDIFHTMVWEADASYANTLSEWSYDMNVQSINLTYTKTFGNKKLKKVNLNSGSEEERKRVE